MANKRIKHFKSLVKEPETKNPGGIFIPEDYKIPIIAAAVSFSLILFIKGLALGYLISVIRRKGPCR